MAKMYDNPRSVFQQQVNKVLINNSHGEDMFENIFKLQQVFHSEKFGMKKEEDKEDWKLILQVFNELGSKNFAKVVNILNGKALKLPTKEDFETAIITNLCYYYKEVLNYSWDKIKESLNMPKLHTITYSVKVKQLKHFIDSMILNKIQGKEDEQCK